MRTIPKIYQIRKEMSAYPSLDGRAIIYFVHNNHADTYISNCEPTVKSNSLDVKILYCGDSDRIPDHVIDKVLVVADNVETSKHPFRWYQFTSEAAALNDENAMKWARKESTKVLLNKIGLPEKVWIFEVQYKDNNYLNEAI
jgi:hypothetical protein